MLSADVQALWSILKVLSKETYFRLMTRCKASMSSISHMIGLFLSEPHMLVHLAEDCLEQQMYGMDTCICSEDFLSEF